MEGKDKYIRGSHHLWWLNIILTWVWTAANRFVVGRDHDYIKIIIKLKLHGCPTKD